jgi:hypothetical protein
MVKYIIIHNKHEGCYDFQYYEDQTTKMRLTSITINPPKIYMFDNKEQAQEFFEEYINDVDVLDIRCKKGDEVEHIDYCTCGIIELDQDENPVLFYNKKNQIFLMENGPKIFLPPQELKNDVKNFNLTNKLIRKCKTLATEQRKRYVELGKYCEECLTKEEINELSDTEDEKCNSLFEIVKGKGKDTVVKEEDIVVKEEDTVVKEEDTVVKEEDTVVKEVKKNARIKKKQ